VSEIAESTAVRECDSFMACLEEEVQEQITPRDAAREGAERKVRRRNSTTRFTGDRAANRPSPQGGVGV
jgi:hypothetical protein